MATNSGPGGAVSHTKPHQKKDNKGKNKGKGNGGGGKQGTDNGTPQSDPAGTLSENDQSVQSNINTFFSQFGLDGLASWAWDAYLNGTPIEQVYIDAQQRPEWQARFPAMAELAAQGHAMSPAEYVAWEKNASELFQAYGLPKGFYDDPSDFKDMLVANVGLPELESRIQLASKAALTAPPEVRDQLRTMYGISDPQGALTAYWLDPTRSRDVLEQQYTAAQIGAEAKITGFGDLNRTEAERLAQLGVDANAARQGFGGLGALGEVTSTTLAGEDAITRQEQLDATFGGDAAAQRKIQNRQERRVGAFQQGGSFTTNQQGRTGIGSQE